MASSDIDFEALRRLSVPERLQLVADLWDSIASDAPDEAFPMTPELAAELDRRWAAHQANPEAARPWEEVEADIRKRLAKRKPA
jgi:putative addiction module component (TIGR02574 family)